MADREHAEYDIHSYVTDNNSTFDEEGFNDIDGLILTQVANMNLGGCGIDIYSEQTKTFNQIYEEMQKDIVLFETFKEMDINNQLLLNELAESPRFKDMIVSNYVCDPVANGVEGFTPVEEYSYSEQFAAVTITYTQNGQTVNYMAFRATDGSTEGWNEDLLMLISGKTQAQADSVAYMNIVGSMLEGDITGGGHSKGGNDFEYGYLFCDESIRDRIVAGYLYDSPGLLDEIINNNPYYSDLQKVTAGHFICTQDSIVGMLLHENENAVFVHSVETGFNEHDPYSWEINSDSFEFVPDEQTKTSIGLNIALDEAVRNMSQKEREALFEFVSFILYHSGGEGLDGLAGLFSVKDENGEFDLKKLRNIWLVLSVDWIHMGMEGQASFGGSLGHVLAAAFATAGGYTVVSAEAWIKIKEKEFRTAIENALLSVAGWLGSERDRLSEFLENVYESYVSGIYKLAEWLYSNSAGNAYSEVQPEICVDTYKLREYSQRLQNVNRRIAALDSRMDSLYLKAGFRDLWNLIQADLLTGHSWKIERCISYLNDTASDFETAERNINSNL